MNITPKRIAFYAAVAGSIFAGGAVASIIWCIWSFGSAPSWQAMGTCAVCSLSAFIVAAVASEV
jgi:hypothetical protein